MSPSYAGITVPEGEPGALRAAASQFGTVAGTLSGISGELRGMPGTMASWQGPASVSYAGSCMTGGADADAAVQALGTAEQAARAYAEALKEAQDDARRAIEQAKEAQQRIDQAERDISAAQGRQTAAWQAADAAAMEIALGSATGSPSPGALEAQSQAWAAADAAAADEARARRELDRARDDLERAKERGREAEEAARDAARAAAGAFGGAAMASPVMAMFGPAASPAGPSAGPGPAGPWWWNTTNEGMQWWNEDEFFKTLVPFHPAHDEFTGRKWWGDQVVGYALGFAGGTVGARAKYWRQAASTYVVSHSTRAGAMRMTTATGRSLLVSYAQRSTRVYGPSSSTIANAAKWAKAGKAMPVVGTLAGMGTAAWDQWHADSSNPNLTTTDRVGRAAGVGVYVGGATAAGAAIGTFFFPGVGTAVGAGIGAVAGLAAGAIAVSIDPVKEAFADAGQWTANAAADAYNWTDDRLQDFETFTEDVERKVYDGIETGAEWVGDQWEKIPDISMPEISAPDIDLPDVDVPDVDLPDVDLPDVDLPGPF